MKIVGIVAWIAVLSLSCFAEPSVVPASTVKGYQGLDGEEVFVLEVNKNKQAIVNMRGVGGEWEGKYLLSTVERQGAQGDRYSYKVKHGDRDWVIFARRRGIFTAWVPEKKDGVRLTSFTELKVKKEIPSTEQFVDAFNQAKKQ